MTLLVPAVACAALACSGQLVPLGDGTGDDDVPGVDGGSTSNEPYYRPLIQADLDRMGCTAAADCHGMDGVPMTVLPAPADDLQWMANYDEVKARAGTTASSLLLGKPTGLGGHTVVLTATSPTLARWREWIGDGAPYQP